MHQNFIQGST